MTAQKGICFRFSLPYSPRYNDIDGYYLLYKT